MVIQKVTGLSDEERVIARRLEQVLADQTLRTQRLSMLRYAFKFII